MSLGLRKAISKIYNTPEGRRKQAARARTHGLTRTPTYRSWQNMKVRCENPSPKDAPYYKNIRYDPRWKIFDNFLADMGVRPQGTTLDRKDNKKGYNLQNCRWGTREQQGQNKRAWVQYKLNEADVRKIRLLRKQGWLYREIAKKFNISGCYVGLIIRKFYWRKVK